METKQLAHCPEIQGNLSAYVDGEVTKSERGMVEAHLTECGACRDKLAETMRLIGAVAALPRVEAGPGYLQALHARMEEPESLADRLVELLTGRGATAGLGFALGAAACFMLMLNSGQPAAAPAASGDGTVEVAMGGRPQTPAVTPIAPVAEERTLVARATSVTPSTNMAGAPVTDRVAVSPVTVASAPAPRVNLAAVTPLPAPPILAPGTVRSGNIPSDAELEGLKLDNGASSTVAAVPSHVHALGKLAAVKPLVDRGIPDSVAARPMKLDPETARPGGNTYVTPSEAVADPARAPEAATRFAELAAALPGGTALLDGDTAEQAASTTLQGHQLQLMVSRPARFLADLTSVVSKTKGAHLERVLVLGQPALQVELRFDDATAVVWFKEELNHLASVKAIAATTTDKNAQRATILIPLSSPIAK